MGGKSLEVFSDSRLVVGQVKGELEARDIRMQEYLGQVKRLQSDSLATLATSSEQGLPRIILVEGLYKANAIKKDIV